MKKIIAVILALLTVLTISGCDFLTNEKNSIGKSGNTVMTVYSALQENFTLKKMEGYNLYGVSFTANIENVGMYTYVYTDKRPDELTYSDILIVKVNNRTGKIEKFSEPDYETYGDEVFELIKNAVPIDPSSFAIDSDTALKNAAAAHRDDSFVYNYVELGLAYNDGRTTYKVQHISLVNNCIYNSEVDVMSGKVISKSVEEL